jgi:hypothetical protein
MDATTMRAIVAYIAELRRDREYHRAIEHTAQHTKKVTDSNWGQGQSSGDDGFDTNCTGESGHYVR